MNNAVTACSATIARPAMDDTDFVEHAVEFAVRLTARSFTDGELRTAAIDPCLEQQARGSLLLLREDLTEHAARTLIRAIRELGAASCSHDVHAAACWCADLLGADDTMRRSHKPFWRR